MRPWSRWWRGDSAETAAAGEPEQPPVTAPRRDWAALPAIHPVATLDPRINLAAKFTAILSSWQDPRFLAPLGHAIGPGAPAGLVVGGAPTLAPNTQMQRSAAAGPGPHSPHPAAPARRPGWQTVLRRLRPVAPETSATPALPSRMDSAQRTVDTVVPRSTPVATPFGEAPDHPRLPAAIRKAAGTSAAAPAPELAVPAAPRQTRPAVPAEHLLKPTPEEVSTGAPPGTAASTRAEVTGHPVASTPRNKTVASAPVDGASPAPSPAPLPRPGASADLPLIRSAPALPSLQRQAGHTPPLAPGAPPFSAFFPCLVRHAALNTSRREFPPNGQVQRRLRWCHHRRSHCPSAASVRHCLPPAASGKPPSQQRRRHHQVHSGRPTRPCIAPGWARHCPPPRNRVAHQNRPQPVPPSDPAGQPNDTSR
ncbi:hypothetical protein [Amycolatopsis taiwanensis]|uniref:Uncharacterized protein n=1 Tax=Amycolatopsis taiwanensis TaxID=342230 RepID=A0A9W6R4D9_9PSEU|nr:hypothetical protein [Amycolatopsis taiwanensis]GLY69048.1 hypothetical protein Atai01_56670 [Amycolatopsis taiwanensis]